LCPETAIEIRGAGPHLSRRKNGARRGPRSYETTATRLGVRSVTGLTKRIPVLGLAVFLATTGWGQSPVAPGDAAQMDRYFSEFKGNTLKCQYFWWTPAREVLPQRDWPVEFTYDLRNRARYEVDLPYQDLAGRSQQVLALLRVTPKESTPVLFARTYKVLRPPRDVHVYRSEFAMKVDGAVDLGQGTYGMDLLLVSDDHRSCRRKWEVAVGKPKDQAWRRFSLNPGEAAPSQESSWDGKLDESGSGIRVTIMFNAFDTGHLEIQLATLASLLTQLPCASVRLVAFALNYRREVLRTEHFGAAEFQTLRKILQDQKQFAAITLDELGRRSAQAYLARLVEKELGAQDASDVVLWLSPTTWEYEVPQKEILPQAKSGGPRFFYFEFFSADSHRDLYADPCLAHGGLAGMSCGSTTGTALPAAGPLTAVAPLDAAPPDSIHYFIKALHGQRFFIRSGNDLSKSIQELMEEIRKEKH